MNQPVTVTFVPQQVFTWIIVGLIAGLLAGLLIRGRRFGFISSVIIGLLGALLGGFIFSVLHITVPLSGGITLQWADIFVSFVGAILILVIFGAFYRYRRPIA